MIIGQFTHKEQQLMREPKFRIWDSYKKEMVYGGFQLWFDGHGELKDTPPIGAYPNIELLEYTGLNDKHGKKIFERDIVKWYGPKGVYTQIVQWIDDEAMFLPNHMKGEVEVIGNTYETPDLIPKDE
jgi:hypothetical protein